MKMDVYLNYEKDWQKFSFRSKRGLLEFLTENDLSGIETITIQFYQEKGQNDDKVQASDNESSRSDTDAKRHKEPRPAT